MTACRSRVRAVRCGGGLATVAGVAAIFSCLSVLAGCTSQESQRRFHLLQHDPVLACHVAGATPWVNLDRIENSGGLGTNDQIVGRWNASIQVFAGPDIFKGQPAVEMIIETPRG